MYPDSQDLDGLKYQSLLEDIRKKALSRGATEVEVSCDIQRAYSVSSRDCDIENIESSLSQSLSLVFYKGKKMAAVSSSDLSMSSLDKLIDKAHSIVGYTEEDQWYGLADKDLLALNYPDLDRYHTWPISSEDAVALVIGCEQSALDGHTYIKSSEGCELQSTYGLLCYTNSHGFSGHYKSSCHSLSCQLIGENDGHMQSDFEYTHACRSEDLWSSDRVASSCVEKVVTRLGSRGLTTRRCPVIFSADVAPSLVSCLYRSISGKAMYREASMFLGSLDKQILPSGFYLKQEPHLACQLSSLPFDGDGVLTRNQSFIEDGRLLSYVMGSYSARRLGFRTTGNACGPLNLSLGPQTVSFDELLQKMDTGFLVTEFLGQGVNLLTGDYSRGAAGFWVEGGKVQYPVEGVTLAGNLVDMFRRIQAVATDVDERRSIRTGSILIEEMMLGGQAE